MSRECLAHAAGTVVLVLIGLGAVVVMSSSFWPNWVPSRIVHVEATTASPAMTVTAEHAWCGDRVPEVSVVEREDGVVVVRARIDEDGTCDDIGMSTQLEIQLDAPLGERVIGLDARLARRACVVDGAPSDRCRRSDDIGP